MNRVECVNGHYYDSDKYPACPECGTAQRKGNSYSYTPSREISNALSGGEISFALGQHQASRSLSGAGESLPPETTGAAARQLQQEDTMLLAHNSDGTPDGGREAIMARPVRQEGGTRLLSRGMDETEEAQCVSNAEDRRIHRAVPDDQERQKPTATEAERAAVPVTAFPDGAGAAPQSSNAVSVPVQPDFPVGWLVGVQGAYRGKAFPCSVGRYRIGRAAGIEICLTGEDSVSAELQAQIVYDPRHAKFFIQAGQDDGRTCLNGDVLFSYSYEELRAYDRICVGQAEFVFLPLCGEKFVWDEN